MCPRRLQNRELALPPHPLSAFRVLTTKPWNCCLKEKFTALFSKSVKENKMFGQNGDLIFNFFTIYSRLKYGFSANLGNNISVDLYLLHYQQHTHVSLPTNSFHNHFFWLMESQNYFCWKINIELFYDNYSRLSLYIVYEKKWNQSYMLTILNSNCSLLKLFTYWWKSGGLPRTFL